MVCINDQRIVIFDDREIDLGVINPDHKVVCGYARHEGVLTPFALVVSDPSPLGEDRDPPRSEA